MTRAPTVSKTKDFFSSLNLYLKYSRLYVQFSFANLVFFGVGGPKSKSKGPSATWGSGEFPFMLKPENSVFMP